MVQNMGGSDLKGGAIWSEDTKLLLRNSTFIENSADEGGAVNFYCSPITANSCSMLTEDCIFTGNSARVGGAIKFNSYIPNHTNAEFTRNVANYGPN